MSVLLEQFLHHVVVTWEAGRRQSGIRSRKFLQSQICKSNLSADGSKQIHTASDMRQTLSESRLRSSNPLTSAVHNNNISLKGQFFGCRAMFTETLYGHSCWPVHNLGLCNVLINETFSSHLTRCLFSILHSHCLHLFPSVCLHCPC